MGSSLNKFAPFLAGDKTYSFCVDPISDKYSICITVNHQVRGVAAAAAGQDLNVDLWGQVPEIKSTTRPVGWSRVFVSRVGALPETPHLNTYSSLHGHYPRVFLALA